MWSDRNCTCCGKRLPLFYKGNRYLGGICPRCVADAAERAVRRIVQRASQSRGDAEKADG